MIVDTQVYVESWPSRWLPGAEPATFQATLQREQVQQAWAGSFAALLHEDVDGANRRLAERCQASQGRLLPFGAVNPQLPDWREDVRRCREQYHMPGIRLHPDFHGYTLDEPLFAELLDLALEHDLIVQLAVGMEDERTQPRLLRVPPVNLSPLAGLLAGRRGLRLVLLNAFRGNREDTLAQLSEVGQVYLELATLEGIAGIDRVLRTLPVERLLFGSFFPYYVLESAVLKLKESELANFQREAIMFRNAQRLLRT